MSQGVLAISEQLEGSFRKVTYEALSEGRRIADHLDCDLIAMVLGSEIENVAKELGHYGADRISWVHPLRARTYPPVWLPV